MNTVSILVVDDDDEVRASLIDELSRDYLVEAAAGGEEAFAEKLDVIPKQEPS